MKDTGKGEFTVHSCSDSASGNFAVLRCPKRVVMDGETKEFTFLWFIENCSYIWHKNGEGLVGPFFTTVSPVKKRLTSPFFTADCLKGDAWELLLFPIGMRVEDKGFISLYLRRCYSDDGPEYVSIKFELSVLAADGSAVSSKEQDCSFGREDERGWDDFLRFDEILFQRHFPQDILTVRCKIWRGEGNVRRASHVCARTRIGIEKISFLHEVENFSTLLPNQRNSIEIRSPTDRSRLAFSSLYFTDDSCRDGEMIIEIAPSGSKRLIYKLTILLLGSENVMGCGKDDNRFDVERKDIRKLPLSLTRQVILDKKTEYLPDDKLSLLCECSFSSGRSFPQIEETQCEMPIATAKLKDTQELSKNDDTKVEKASAYPSVSEDLKEFYVNQSLTDVEVKTKTKSFPAHKLLLCARSVVFNAMMTSDVKEKHNNCIQVDDLEDDVVQQLLLFLYSDTVENLQWKLATQLYYAADKYQVGKLKEVCSSFLVENLSPKNAGELLLLTDTHSDTDLKKTVEDFILEHEEQVYGSDEWEMLLETHPLLAVKAMHLKYKRKKMK